MPSLYMATFSSSDGENVSLKNQLGLNKIKQCPESSTEKQISLTSNHCNNPQSSLEAKNETYFETKPNGRQRFPSTDLLEDNQVQEKIKHVPRSMDNILLEQKFKSSKKILFKSFIIIITYRT